VTQSKIRVQAGTRDRSLGRPPRPAAATLAALAGLWIALGGLGGCTKTDSWFDPSVVGYWEHTPTQVPILRRLSSIEGPEDEYVEITEVTADDLRPDDRQYRIGAGDQLQIVIWDMPTPGQPTPFDRMVDHRGAIDLPQLGEISLLGQSVEQARATIGQAMADKNLVNIDPLISITVTNPQQRIFTMMGSVAGPGPHYIPTSDYRLLEAIADAGGIAETVREILVIRKMPLSDAASGGDAPANPANTNPPGSKPANNERLIDLIDQIGGDKPEEKPAGGGSPGVLSGSSSSLIYRQPATEAPASQPQPTDSGAPSDGKAPKDTWVFVNNQWVQVKAPLVSAPARSSTDGLPKPTEVSTQRVIRIPVPELLGGDPRYNMVIRPGDIIRVPNPATGTVYLGGEINRPGAFSMAPGLTLMRVIDAAGGLSAIGIPERVDIVRMTSDDRQAMLRLDLRAINEGSQPDIYLKANDRINIGTSFWAYPLAVMRSGFRFTYGFGFIFDRNFSDYIITPYNGGGLINP